MNIDFTVITLLRKDCLEETIFNQIKSIFHTIINIKETRETQEYINYQLEISNLNTKASRIKIFVNE